LKKVALHNPLKEIESVQLEDESFSIATTFLYHIVVFNGKIEKEKKKEKGT